MDTHLNTRPAYTIPTPPIPEPIRGSEVGTFAHHTITVRMPGIARRLLTDNDFPPETARQVESLVAELPACPVRLIQDDTAPDTGNWEHYTAPHLGRSWLEVPWFFAEHYFYRRILEATGYFRPGPGQSVDPFAGEKGRGLLGSQAEIQALALRMDGWSGDLDHKQEVLSRLLKTTLWGNQGDLSMWPVDKNDRPDHQDASQQDEHLVVDETAAILAHLLKPASLPKQVDLILDNAGFELVCDLAFAGFLLSSGTVKTVQLHLKAHPTFVSDATIEDVHRTLAGLAAAQYPSVERLAERLQGHLDSGRLRLFDAFFWNSPLAFWEMPSDMRQVLASSDLVISKGDANYRRLSGDRHWPLSAPLADVLRYFPTPLALVRVLKSETVIGLQPGQPGWLSRQDPGWMTDGMWGVVQYWPGG